MEARANYGLLRYGGNCVLYRNYCFYVAPVSLPATQLHFCAILSL
jgi:hypothetical protein